MKYVRLLPDITPIHPVTGEISPTSVKHVDILIQLLNNAAWAKNMATLSLGFETSQQLKRAVDTHAKFFAIDEAAAAIFASIVDQPLRLLTGALDIIAQQQIVPFLKAAAQPLDKEPATDMAPDFRDAISDMSKTQPSA